MKWRPIYSFVSYLAQFPVEWEMFQTKVVEKTKTHILCSETPPPPPQKSCRLWDNVEKCGRAWQATGDNMAHAHCMLDTQGYRPTLRICNTDFPLQQWLHGHASILRYTYSAPIVQWLINFVYILFLSCRSDVCYTLLYFFCKEMRT
jgi:hypothetical protein